MGTSSDSDRPAAGLRERKKARTKATIRQQALRLFVEKGYDATTIEQIAEAAEVSVSTIFRYFANKDELIVSDDYDPLFVAAFKSQPPELSPMQALQAAVGAAFAQMSEGDLAAERDRELLIMSVPHLWAASLRNLTRSMGLVADLVAERTGRAPDDPAVRTFTGAVFGVMLEVMLRWADDPALNPRTALDEAFKQLAAGVPL